MTDLHMLDCAKLPNGALPQTDVWAGYIGGAAENVWSDNDWKRVASHPKLPIYVTRPDKTGTYCGLEAIMAIYKLGIPRSTAVAADLELLNHDIGLMNEWLIDFYHVLSYFGYMVWKYGSTSYLFDITAVDGAWVATDSKVQEHYNHAGEVATQWDFGNEFDYSIIRRVAVHHRLSESWRVNG